MNVVTTSKEWLSVLPDSTFAVSSITNISAGRIPMQLFHKTILTSLLSRCKDQRCYPEKKLYTFYLRNLRLMMKQVSESQSVCMAEDSKPTSTWWLVNRHLSEMPEDA